MGSNRTNFVDWLTSIGGDPQQSGFPFAGGAQPVIDISGASFPARKIYAIGNLALAAGGAGNHNELVLQVNVPTLVWTLSFNSATGATFGSVRIAAVNGSFTTEAFPQTGYTTLARQNRVGTRVNAAPVTTQFQIVEGVGLNSNQWFYLLGGQPMAIDRGHALFLPDPTANVTTDFGIVWEEQISPE